LCPTPTTLKCQWTDTLSTEQERLPYKEGWRPPKEQVTGFVMAQEVMELALATPEKTVWWGEGKPPGKQTTYDIPQCPNRPRFKF